MSRAKTPVERILSKSNRLPALSAAVIEVIRLSGDSRSSANRLAAALKVEPNLAGRVLKLANSPYYGLAKEVAVLSDAVCLLGNVMVRNLALLASAEEWFRDNSLQGDPALRAMWRRAVAVAIASHILGGSQSSSLGEEALSAGLLHDVGKLVLTQYQPGTYAKVVKHAETKSMPIWEAEAIGFGLSHVDVGLAVVEPWALPSRLVDAIRYHHSPSAPETPDPLTDVVHSADVLVRTMGIGLAGDDYLVTVDRAAMARAGLHSRRDALGAMVAVEQGLARAYDMLDAA